MTIFFKLKTILIILFLLNLMIFTRNDVEAKIKDYGKALSEILKVYPPTGDIEEAKEKYGEPEKPDVEFSKDMKFLNMTLKDSIILALQNNYDIKIAKLDPMVKEKDITVEKSVFDPVLEITGGILDSETPSNSGVLLGGTSGGEPARFQRDTKTIDASLEKLFSTGAMFTLGFNIVRSDVDPQSAFAFENPVTQGFIESKITQTLLKNAGIFYNRSKIYIARNNKE